MLWLRGSCTLASQSSHPPLQVAGAVTYNGHATNEFVVRRTAAYVDQVQHQPSLVKFRTSAACDFELRALSRGRCQCRRVLICCLSHASISHASDLRLQVDNHIAELTVRRGLLAKLSVATKPVPSSPHPMSLVNDCVRRSHDD